MRYVAITILFLCIPAGVHATTLAEFNALPQTPPAWFAANAYGGFYGETETGDVFTQDIVATDTQVRMQKFTFANHSFFVTDRGVIFAEDTLTAVSVYLARV